MKHRVGDKVFLLGGIALLVIGVALAIVNHFTTHLYYPPAPLPVHQTLNQKHHMLSQLTDNTSTDPRPTVDPNMPSMRLIFPAIGANARLLPEPITDNALQIPPDVHHVGWWSGGGQLSGSSGTVLLAGHVNYVGQGPGALSQLAYAHVGETITTVGPHHMTQDWTVDKVTSLIQADLPQDIFTSTGPRRLVIVTCGGTLEPDHYYNENVLVYAEPTSTVTNSLD